MRYNELKWEHLAKVLVLIGKGQSTLKAAQSAGISTSVWNRARRDWAKLPGHLANVDPLGSPVDLDRLDNRIRDNLSNGGRPQGAKDHGPRVKRHTKGVPLPTLRVKDSSFYVEDGVFYVEDEG